MVVDPLQVQQSNLLFAVNSPVTPAPGGGSDGTLVGLGITFVNPPASNGDSLQLPAAIPGSYIRLARATGDSNNVPIWRFATSSDTFNGQVDNIDWVTDGLPSEVPSGSIEFVCFTAGEWLTNGVLD